MRTVTSPVLRTRALQRADATNDPHISTSEIDNLLDVAICELWDTVVSVQPRRRWSILAAAANPYVDIGETYVSTPADLLFLEQVYLEATTGEFIPLTRFQESQRTQMRPVTDTTLIVRSFYVPCAPRVQLTTGVGAHELSVLDGINGWEEIVVLGAAIRILTKQDRDPSALIEKQMDMILRVADAGDIDRGEPQRVNARASSVSAAKRRTQAVHAYELNIPDGVIRLYRFNDRYLMP